MTDKRPAIDSETRQKDAKVVLALILGRPLGDGYDACTANADTCPIDECMLCGVRDCPDNEPLHYHHDGCPACWQKGL